MLITDDRDIYERAIAWGHYARRDEIENPELKPNLGLPFGGIKGRMCQWASAMGRVQLKYYPQRMEDIQKSLKQAVDDLSAIVRAERCRTAGKLPDVVKRLPAAGESVVLSARHPSASSE